MSDSSSSQSKSQPNPSLSEQLIRSGILTPVDFEQVFNLDSELVAGPDTNPDKANDPEQVARRLQERGLATPHQAKAIARNRIENLRYGPYLVIERLGRGGFGVVYKARHTLLNRIVALKTIRADLFENEAMVQRFLREVEVLGQMNHRNVVAAQNADRRDDEYYLVMEYVEGTNLFKLVRDSESPLPLVRVRSCMAQAAAGLDYAHQQGIVHRDVKPDNLMLAHDGVVKVLDLGLAKFAHGGQSMTGSGIGMGTPDYMAPEQWKDFRRVDARVDIYALGCTLYFLCAGRPPYAHKENAPTKMMGHVMESPPSLREARPDAPKRLEAIYQKMMAKEPDDRFATMKDVIAALKGLSKPKTSVSTAVVPVSDSVSEPVPESEAAPLPAPVAVASTADDAIVFDPRPQSQDLHLRLAPEPGAIAAPAVRTPDLRRGIGIVVCAVAVVGIALAIASMAMKPDPIRSYPDRAARKPYQPDPSFAESIGIQMVAIREGTFEMGSTEQEGGFSDERPKHTVEITKAFWMSAHEITVGQFRRFVEDENYQIDGEWKNPGFPQTDAHPVVNISWNDAVNFCEWLSRKVGRKFELPTEAQWEYACRAGSTTRYSFGDDPAGLTKAGNIEGNVDKFQYTAPVGSFSPNAWGLYDMHGNVLEWCLDIYDEKYYEKSPRHDPVNLGGNADFVASGRVFRGGSWVNKTGYVSSANRSRHSLEYRYFNLGFRVASVQQP